MKNFNISLMGFFLFLFAFGYSQDAQLQLIHNSPDNSLKSVDIYINGVLTLDNLNYRTASTFIPVSTAAPTFIEVTAANHVAGAPAILSMTVNMVANTNYIMVLDGMNSTAGYSHPMPLKLSVYDKARIKPLDPNNIDILFYNGSTDAAMVNIEETGIPLGRLFANTPYGTFSPEYMALRKLDYSIKVNTTDSASSGMTQDLGSYYLSLRTMGLTVEAVTLLTSGFVHPELNNNGPQFGMFLALPSGSNLIPLDRVALRVNDFSTSNILMYPNPASSILNLQIPFIYNKADAKVIDISGREVFNIFNLTNEINISGLSNGLYLMNLTIDDKNYVQKFIVNR